MATRVQTIMIDDVDGTEAEDVKTVTFAHEGVTYEVDLSPKNSEKLKKALTPFIDAGRRMGGRRVPSQNRGAARANRADIGAIRQWALDNGYQVSNRGRIPTQVEEAYHAANAS